jgi:hypothetical protein
MTTKTLVTLAATLGFVSIAGADPLPKPVEGLGCLVGNWKFAGSVTMGKDTIKTSATLQCKATSAKFGVTCTMAVKGIPGVGTYAETDLFGYDPATNKYHWFSVTNAGETHDHVADLPTSSKLQFVFNGTQEGKPLKEVIDLEMAQDDKSFTLRSETFIAGASAVVFEGKARK